VDLRDVLHVEPGKHTRFARRVIGVIAAIHTISDVPPLSIRVLAQPDRERHGSFDGSLIVVNRLSATRELALVHEVGHALDRFGIGTEVHVDASTAQHPLLRDWQRSVSQSRAVQRLHELRAEMPASGTAAGSYIDYILSARELFARSYAQWIALRSGDEELLTDVERIRADRNPLMTLVQWESDEFDLLADVFDQLMETLGWMR
jgi:hypothetical protein